jgi:hypothetical protein
MTGGDLGEQGWKPKGWVRQMYPETRREMQDPDPVADAPIFDSHFTTIIMLHLTADDFLDTGKCNPV